ncbi:MAG TPA: hypothetical protein VIJ94_20520 [Caulobacteraceae bacterium]
MHATARDLQSRHGFQRDPTPLDRLHLSLAGLGEVAEPPGCGWTRDIGDAISRVRMPPFLVQMNTVLSFRRGRHGLWPVVLTGEDGVIGAGMLGDAIGAALRREGVGCRLASTQHVTLAWSELFVPEQPIPPISWTAREFVLIDSLQGAGRHQLLGRWPLAA